MTLGSFSGNGTFTAPGSANPTKLFIPQKDDMDGPTRTMAQTLETFINSLNSVGATSTDRYSAHKASTSSNGNVNWSSATVVENVGSSITVNGSGNIVTGPAGIYSISFLGQISRTGSVTTNPQIFWSESGHSYQIGQSIFINASATTTDYLSLAVTFYFPANDVHTFSFNNASSGGGSSIYWVWVQRISD